MTSATTRAQMVIWVGNNLMHKHEKANVTAKMPAYLTKSFRLLSVIKTRYTHHHSGTGGYLAIRRA